MHSSVKWLLFSVCFSVNNNNTVICDWWLSVIYAPLTLGKAVGGDHSTTKTCRTLRRAHTSPTSHQLFLYHQQPLKFLLKSIHNFLSYPANKQTNVTENTGTIHKVNFH